MKTLDPAVALQKVAVALSRFADDGNKARLVQELFGKSLKEVAPLLVDLAEKGKLVASTTTEQAKAVEAFRKSSFALTADIQDLARSFTSDIIPAIQKFTTALNDAKKAYGSLTEAADIFSLRSDKGVATNLLDTQEKIDRLKKDADSIVAAEGKGGFLARFMGDFNKSQFASINEQLRTLEGRKAFLRAQQTRDALAGTEGQILDKFDRPKPSVNIPDKPDKAARIKDDYGPLIKSLTEKIALDQASLPASKN